MYAIPFGNNEIVSFPKRSNSVLCGSPTCFLLINLGSILNLILTADVVP